MKSLSKREVNSLYDSEPGLHHKYILEISKPFIRKKTVLDVGCWTGQYTQLAARYAKKVYGFDPSKAAIALAKKQTPSAIFKVGSALKIPFNNSSFDVVIFSEVLEHIPSGTEHRAISEIHRVLKPKGMLILTTPRNHPISILLDPAFFLIGHRHYSKIQIEDYLRDCEFIIKEIYFSKGFINLITWNIEAILKLLFKKKLSYPLFLKKALKKEHNKKGFSSIFAIAQRT